MHGLAHCLLTVSECFIVHTLSLCVCGLSEWRMAPCRLSFVPSAQCVAHKPDGVIVVFHLKITRELWKDPVVFRAALFHRIPSSLQSPLFLVHSIARFGGVPLHGEALSMSGGLSVFELMIFSVESSLTVHCEMADILGHSLCGRHRTMMRREQAE